MQPLEHPPQGGIGKLDVQRNLRLILLVGLIATEPNFVRYILNQALTQYG